MHKSGLFTDRLNLYDFLDFRGLLRPEKVYPGNGLV
jgi:hypothetical protein